MRPILPLIKTTPHISQHPRLHSRQPMLVHETQTCETDVQQVE